MPRMYYRDCNDNFFERVYNLFPNMSGEYSTSGLNDYLCEVAALPLEQGNAIINNIEPGGSVATCNLDYVFAAACEKENISPDDLISKVRERVKHVNSEV